MTDVTIAENWDQKRVVAVGKMMKQIIILFFVLAMPSVVSADDELGQITKYYPADNGDIVVLYGDINKAVSVEDINKSVGGKGYDLELKPGKATDFEQPVLANDHKTLGWLVDYNHCNSTYSCPFLLVIYRNGKILQKLTGDESGFIWGWKFIKNASQVAMQSGFAHFNPETHYLLYDVKTGKVIGNADESQKLPVWTQGLHR